MSYKINAAIARTLFGWKTLADISPNPLPWAATTWVDPVNGISNLPTYCDSVDLCLPIFALIQAKGTQAKFMVSMQQAAKELNIKYDNAFPMFSMNSNLICQAIVDLYGLTP